MELHCNHFIINSWNFLHIATYKSYLCFPKIALPPSNLTSRNIHSSHFTIRVWSYSSIFTHPEKAYVYLSFPKSTSVPLLELEKKKDNNSETNLWHKLMQQLGRTPLWRHQNQETKSNLLIT